MFSIRRYNSEVNTDEFTLLLQRKGEELYRDMPWRDDTRPYYVLVSELMLQQTQVLRVVPKFQAFINRFPNETALVNASLADVIKLWQGLGYNRRAKFLHQSAGMIMNEFGGVFPEDEVDMLSLPGVGKNTAGAIRAYAFNQPSIFVETNIRTVYIHHFFNDTFEVDDKDIVALLETSLDYSNPRRFYQNLMDYGSWLKANGVRNISSSKHYKRQSPLEGSIRQVRGQILRELASEDLAIEQLMDRTTQDHRFDVAIKGLMSDGIVGDTDGVFHLTK